MKILLWIAVICLLCVPSAWAFEIPVTIDAPTTVSVGESFDLLIKGDLSDLPVGLYSAGFRLYGANPCFKVLSIELGAEFLNGVSAAQTNAPGPGIIETISPGDPGVFGPTLATFKMKAISGGPADLTLDFWGSPQFQGGSFDNFLDYNGVVVDDLIAFGRASVEVTGKAVPEPCTLVTLLLGGIAWRFGRRKQR